MKDGTGDLWEQTVSDMFLNYDREFIIVGGFSSTKREGV